MGHGETKCMQGRKSGFIFNNIGGGTTDQRSPDSWEGFHYGAPHIWGMLGGHGQLYADNQIQDIMDNCDTLVICGCDAETTNWGFLSQCKTQQIKWYKQLGKKHIFISPELNYFGTHCGQQPTYNNPTTGKPMWDKWIPAYPNTEGAMWQAIAYVWLQEGTYDKDYIDKYTVHFDKFQDMILGKEDGVPKTPEWAAPLCGVPSRIIKALAKVWASTNTSMVHNNSGPYVRGPYSTEPPRLECYLLAMQGMGKPGRLMHKMTDEEIAHGFVFSTILSSSYPNPMLTPNTDTAGPSNGTNIQSMGRELMHWAFAKPPVEWWDQGYPGQIRLHFAYPGPWKAGETNDGKPTPGWPLVKLIWDSIPNWQSGCGQYANKYLEAIRTPGNIETYVAQQQWFENMSMFADLNFPVQTLLEHNDIAYTQYEWILSLWYSEQAIPPLGESLSDFGIYRLVAEKLDEIMPGYDLVKKLTAGLSEDGMQQRGFDGCGLKELKQKGLPPGYPYDIPPDWETFKQMKYYLMPVDPDWNKRIIAGAWGRFLQNPDDPKNKLTTPTGKIEFVSEGLAEVFPDDIERPPLAHWGVKPYAPYGKTHGDPTIGSEFALEWFKQDENPRAKMFPLILETGKPKWRQHTLNDQMPWTREIETCKVRGPDGYQYEPMWIHPIDANQRGIKSGDALMVWNERGATMAGARISERIKPGVVYQEHGARSDPLNVPENLADQCTPASIDRGGITNHFAPHWGNSVNCKNSGCWTAFLVQVQKADLASLRAQYPDAFNRPYDPNAGLMTKAWVNGSWPTLTSTSVKY
jgi:anaerobic selenocysteine-containing dehydrogenase